MAGLPDLRVLDLAGIQRNFEALQRDLNTLRNRHVVPRSFTTATRPAAASSTGTVIYVTDGAPGSRFQGSDGATWVSLG
ncbi:MAG: hypothetical protein H0W36_12805 [Gemmatimonadetes bacterium]|nr:hypothetical protein [Gemmatimonadota bacterium]